MNFLKALFGNSEAAPEDKEKANAERKFDLMKYDGIKAMRMGKYDYAERCFREALSIKDDLEIHENLSRVLLRLERIPEAIAELEILLIAEPANISLLLNIAHYQFMDEDYSAMVKTCERALALNADHPTVHLLYAQAAIGSGDLVTGLARLTKAIALKDDFADARLLRGQTLLQLGDARAAQKDSDWLLQETEANEDTMLLSARVASALGMHEKAISIYDNVIEMNPFLVEAYAERGKLYFNLGNKKQAEEDMKKVLELNPQQLSDVSGDYSAEGIEHQTKRAYSMMNPFGI